LTCIETGMELVTDFAANASPETAARRRATVTMLLMLMPFKSSP